jgi:putative membrane protein
MLLLAQIVIGIVLLIHVYIVLLETVLFDTRGRRVFGLSAEKAAIVKPAMSNQGCYNGFLAAALAVSFLHPNPEVAHGPDHHMAPLPGTLKKTASSWRR